MDGFHLSMDINVLIDKKKSILYLMWVRFAVAVWSSFIKVGLLKISAVRRILLRWTAVEMSLFSKGKIMSIWEGFTVISVQNDNSIKSDFFFFVFTEFNIFFTNILQETRKKPIYRRYSCEDAIEYRANWISTQRSTKNDSEPS